MKRLMSWALILSVLLGITFHTQINRTVFEEIPLMKTQEKSYIRISLCHFLPRILKKQLLIITAAL
jgi:hypothetical protein